MSFIRVPHLGQDGPVMTDDKYLRCSAIFSPTLLLAERDTDTDFSGGLFHLKLNPCKMVTDGYRS
jgi:hypothetical protein